MATVPKIMTISAAREWIKLQIKMEVFRQTTAIYAEH